MHASLRKFLGTPEEINGDCRCATYLIAGRSRSSVVGERFVSINSLGTTGLLILHDHRKRFISIGLWGSYRETQAGRRSPIPRAVVLQFPDDASAPDHDALEALVDACHRSERGSKVGILAWRGVLFVGSLSQGGRRNRPARSWRTTRKSVYRSFRR
jgi:hypothetical protein